MNLKSKLRAIIDVALEEESSPEDHKVSRLRHRLTDGDVRDFHSAASRRTPSIFIEMDALLDELKVLYPVTARRVRRDIKWLRKKAGKNGLSWGIK